MNKDNVEEEIDYFDYFHTKYGSDVSDLFLDIREITEGFCLNLFKENKHGSFHLTEFIFDNIILEDEIYNEEEDNLIENNEEENIV